MMQQDQVAGQTVPVTAAALREGIYRVFFWMTFGLGVTALVAMGIASSSSLEEAIIENTALWIVVVFAQLGIVIAFTALAQRVSTTALAGLFLVYSVLVGVTFSFVFITFTKESIASTFFITAGTFGATALFGAVTKRDLTAVGSLAFMGLIGFLLASVVNIFLQSSALLWITTFVGIAVFIGLTAYDMQKMKADAGTLALEGDARERWALMWALRFYLDFINLFLLLLRLFGNRR